MNDCLPTGCPKVPDWRRRVQTCRSGAANLVDLIAGV